MQLALRIGCRVAHGENNLRDNWLSFAGRLDYPKRNPNCRRPFRAHKTLAFSEHVSRRQAGLSGPFDTNYFMRASLKTLVRSLLGVAMLAAVAGSQAQLTNLVPRTQVWRYQTNCQANNGWETAAFNDSAWPSGPGGFTGGETTAALLAQCATTNLPAPNAGGAGGRPNYFRTHFNVGSTAGLSLTFSNAVDDGARVFLNGVEIFSLRGPATNDCPAFSTGGAPGAGTDALLWEVVSRTAAQLSGIIQTGDNVLAVSVHQANATSSDLLFAQVMMGQIEFAPTINYAASSLSNRTVRQCRATTLNVVASGAPAPTFQWLQNGVSIANATNASYAITNMQASDAGNYHVQVSNALGSTNSTPDTVLSYAPDTNAPVVLLAWASVQDASNRITVVFDELLDAASATTAVNYSVTDTNTGLPSAVLSAVLVNSTTVALTVSPDLQPTHGYALLVSGVADACAGNLISPAAALSVSSHAHAAIPLAAAALWKYDQSGVSLGTNWTAASYNDAAWLTGAGTFDAKRTNATSPLPLCRPVLPTNGEPVRTCLTLSNASSSAQIPTSYFRKRFLFSDGTNGAVLRVVSLVDDGAVYYLNGVELARIGMPAGTISYSTPASRTVTEPAYETNYFLVSPLLSGLNTFAVELHQVSLTSSDLTFGLQLDVLATAPPAPLAPAVFVQPQSIATSSGLSAVFNVNVGGTGPFAYQWHVNCRDIPNATNASLVISNLTAADVGTYSVTVSNLRGQATSWDAALELTNVVFGPGPNLRATLGTTNVLLTWPVSAGTFQLQDKADLNLPAWSNTSASVSIVGPNYLVSVPYSGAVKFFRLIGTSSSSSFRILTHPLGRSASLGDNVTLSVNATGAPPLAYVWRFNGQNLPSATNATLTVTLTNVAQFGAYAAWVIEQGTNEVLSRPAGLRPAGLETNGADFFADRATFTNLNGSIHGITFGATKQAGELNHAGKPGGRSVWIQWRPPVSGITTFDTYGSGFDTLLAAYTGTTLSNLTLLAADDDSGDNVGSRVQFNASTNVNYQIAVDGLVGAGGFFVLNWSLDAQPASVTLPVIDEQPHDAILNTNVSVVTNFTVVAHGLPPLTALSYQWYRDGATLTNATNATLIVGTGGVPLMLGNYSVEVQNSARVVRSRAVALQFSTAPGLRFWPKPDEDLLCGSTAENNTTNCCGAGFASGGKGGPGRSFEAAASGSCTAGTITSLANPLTTPSKWKWVRDMHFTSASACTLTLEARTSAGTLINGRIVIRKKLANGSYTTSGYTSTTATSFTYVFNAEADTTYDIATGSANATDVHTLTYTVP